MIRKAAYPIMDIILNRHSPRAMSSEPISDQQLMALFEAARWAPSSYNNQPWKFIYAKRDSTHWQKFLSLLAPANQSWAKNAAALVVTISRDAFYLNNKPSRTHTFDTGSAWQNLALQGSHDGLVVHGMEGFDYDAAKRVLEIPDGYTVEMMFAVGKPADASVLPKEMQAGEEPNDRLPVEQLVCEGVFKEERLSK